jgi:hypothetical protein
MHSVQCPGLVVSSSDVGAQLTLQIATGEDATLWNFLSNGLIESMKYPGFAIVVDGSNLKLSGPIQTAAPVIKRVGINTTTGEYIQIFELEIFDPTGTNVVRGKAATSSSVHHTPSIFPGGTAGPSNAVDGDLTNVFHTNSRHDGGDNNPWLNIDLGASVEACKIVIYNKWCGDVNDSAHPCLCRLSQANLKLYDSSNNVIKTINVGDTCGKAILEYDLCLKPEIAKTAMNRCDESMALLVGSQTSLGTLKAIADLVKAEGPERMPGSCCFDTPTSNDTYLGVAVRQLL